MTLLPQPEPVGDRELIVVADDNADMRKYLRHLLDGQYEVHTVSDGRQALATTRLLRPALLLADVMMPQLGGFGLLRAVREDAVLASTPLSWSPRARAISHDSKDCRPGQTTIS